MYKNNSNYSSDVLFTVKEGKVYKGNSNYSSDILMNIKDGKLYKKNSNYSSDVILTIRDGKVYNGNSSYNSDVLFTIDNLVTIEEFVAIYYVYKGSFSKVGSKEKNNFLCALNHIDE